MAIPQKLKIELPCDLAVLPLHIYLEKLKQSSRNICTPMFMAFLIDKKWKQTVKDEWINQYAICHRTFIYPLKGRKKFFFVFFRQSIGIF